MKNYSTIKRQEIPLKTFKIKSKFFGALGENLVFRRSVRLSKHLYRNIDGFGIDRWIVEDLMAHGCQEIEIFEKEEAMFYRISFMEFVQHSVLIDHGFGVQLICPRKFFLKEKKEKDQLSLFDAWRCFKK